MKQPPIKTKELSGSTVQIADGQNWEIASITAYGENAQGGTTETPVALTGVENVFVGGRNLLPKATLTETISGVTFTPNPDGSVSVSGTATSDSYYTFAHYMERALLGQTVCLSGSSQLVTVVINERTSSATFVRNVLVDRGQGASGIVTKRKDSNVLYAVLQVKSGDTVNETVYPMLNLGTTALPYEPYQGSVTPLPIPRPLHEVGEVRDICCTRIKSIYDKRIVIDQNSVITMSGEGSIVGTSRRFNVPAEDIPITNDAVIEPVRCNILPARPSGGVSGTYALDAPGISLQNNQSVSQPNINIRVPGCKTLEEIKAWLADNPLIVYYQSTAYDGTNGLDVCLTEYQTGFVELDGTESNLQFFSEYQTLAIKGITTAGDPSQANAYGVCISSHFALVPPGTSTTLDKVVYGQPKYNQIIIHDTSWNSLETAKAYLAAQKAAGTPVQIAYQLATPETYATDPLDIDNAAGPLTVMTGGEVEVTLTHRMLTPYTAWTIQYDSEGEYTGDFFNVEDYDRIKQNIEYLREYAYFLYGGFTLRGMVAVTVESYGYASTIDALDANLEAIAANTFRPPDMLPVKQWRGNQPPPGADDWNRIENTCLLLFEQFERQFACLPKLAFELKGSAF